MKLVFIESVDEIYTSTKNGKQYFTSMIQFLKSVTLISTAVYNWKPLRYVTLDSKKLVWRSNFSRHSWKNFSQVLTSALAQQFS